ASQVGTTGVHHNARLGFLFLGLELLRSSYRPASASQSAGITGISHHARPQTKSFPPTGD
ncbi:putative uncharacterized protein FLJ38264, partial [Nycticebus coucang]|uniref:putative uncharacterized protein FLJ38264 n=1 Tax=Nycticebus coucang TaxID=9470 RepID=UPI00234C1BC9